MENHNATPADAIARLNRARIGSLVNSDGNKLTKDNLDYLIQLRNSVFGWIDAIENEIARIEAS